MHLTAHHRDLQTTVVQIVAMDNYLGKPKTEGRAFINVCLVTRKEDARCEEEDVNEQEEDGYPSERGRCWSSLPFGLWVMSVMLTYDPKSHLLNSWQYEGNLPSKWHLYGGSNVDIWILVEKSMCTVFTKKLSKVITAYYKLPWLNVLLHAAVLWSCTGCVLHDKLVVGSITLLMSVCLVTVTLLM